MNLIICPVKKTRNQVWSVNQSTSVQSLLFVICTCCFENIGEWTMQHLFMIYWHTTYETCASHIMLIVFLCLNISCLSPPAWSILSSLSCWQDILIVFLYFSVLVVHTCLPNPSCAIVPCGMWMWHINKSCTVTYLKKTFHTK